MKKLFGIILLCASLSAFASGVSSTSNYNPSAVAITGGTINGTGITGGTINGTGITDGTITNVDGTTQAVGNNSTKLATTAFHYNAHTFLDASLTGDVALTATGSYFDGPSVSQGTSGTWCAVGAVTVSNTAAGDNYYAKLWDGTSIIASSVTRTAGAAVIESVSLSGCINSPAGNIRISVRDINNTANTAIRFNSTGNSRDSTITVFRIR